MSEVATRQSSHSLREYGRHRNVTHAAVSKAIQRGRLTRSVVLVNGSPRITSFDLADEEWLANTHHMKNREFVKAASGAPVGPIDPLEQFDVFCDRDFVFLATHPTLQQARGLHVDQDGWVQMEIPRAAARALGELLIEKSSQADSDVD